MSDKTPDELPDRPHRKRLCSCGHHWTSHDLYGCVVYECDCVRIDEQHWFDRATNTDRWGQPPS